MDIKKLGINIKKARNNRGLTQKELADKISRTESSIRKYEKGIVDIPNKVINEIASVLEVSVTELTGTDSIRSDFEQDFDVNVFDEDVMKYILGLNYTLKQISSGQITNTLIIQNIIINRIAEETALKRLNMYPNKSLLLEFDMDEQGNLRTGKELKESLIKKYKEDFLEEKLELLKKSYKDIVEYDEESLKNTRKYYNDIPKHKIPQYILEKLYPDYVSKIEAIEIKKRETTIENFLEGLVNSIMTEVSEGKEIDATTLKLFKDYYEYLPDVVQSKINKYLQK